MNGTLGEVDDELDRIADLPDDGSRQKETFARFGLAVYQAQVFERGMVNLIVMATADASRKGTPMTRHDIDHLNDDLFGDTGGQLVNRLLAAMPAEAALLETCRRAVKERNRLIHHFFCEHEMNFRTSIGMQRMVDDADRVRRLFREADRATTEILHAGFRKLGITQDEIWAEFDQLRQEAHDPDDGPPFESVGGC